MELSEIALQRTLLLAGVLLLAVVAHAPAAHAQDDGSCGYAGRRYASGFAICQARQVQVCVGGEWQTSGTFCVGSPDGQALGVPVLGPGHVDTAGVHAEGAPVQNAPLDDQD
jgi:hypothetical protein